MQNYGIGMPPAAESSSKYRHLQVEKYSPSQISIIQDFLFTQIFDLHEFLTHVKRNRNMPNLDVMTLKAWHTANRIFK